MFINGWPDHRRSSAPRHVLAHEGGASLGLALTRRFLGRLSTKSRRCRHCRQLLRLSVCPKRRWTNSRTTFQFQSASSIPAADGDAWTAAFNSACCWVLRVGGTTGVLEAQTDRPRFSKARQPLADGVRIALQRLRHLRGRPALGQQPHGMPALTLPRYRRAVHLLPHRARVQLPSFQCVQDFVHRRTPPRAPFLGSLPRPSCVFHFGSGLVADLNVHIVDGGDITKLLGDVVECSASHLRFSSPSLGIRSTGAAPCRPTPAWHPRPQPAVRSDRHPARGRSCRAAQGSAERRGCRRAVPGPARPTGRPPAPGSPRRAHRRRVQYGGSHCLGDGHLHVSSVAARASGPPGALRMAVRSVPEPAAQLAPPPVSRGREELPPDPCRQNAVRTPRACTLSRQPSSRRSWW